VRVGGKTFTEQYVLAELLSGVLERAGLPVEKVEGLGSSVVFDALVAGDLDVYVDYSGTLWANHLKRGEPEEARHVLAEVTRWLAAEHGVECLGALGFENAYALAMRAARAQALGVRSIEQLAEQAPRLRIGSDYEFFGRPEWTRLQATYGLRFREQVSFDPSFMYRAVQGDEVDVITAFSSDGRIAAYDLRVLEDSRRAFPPYDAILLLGPHAKARWPQLAQALRPLVGAIDVERMRRANMMVDVEGKTRKEAARWLLGALRKE
jgi:osmoprotectant transport system permease protein